MIHNYSINFPFNRKPVPFFLEMPFNEKNHSGVYKVIFKMKGFLLGVGKVLFYSKILEVINNEVANSRSIHTHFCEGHSVAVKKNLSILIKK